MDSAFDQFFQNPKILCERVPDPKSCHSRQPTVCAALEYEPAVRACRAFVDGQIWIEQARNLKSQIVLIRPEPRQRIIGGVCTQHGDSGMRALILRGSPAFQTQPLASPRKITAIACRKDMRV